MDTVKLSVFTDIGGHRNTSWSTLDPALAVSLERLDLVIHDTCKNTVEICELTAGHESNINKNHKLTLVALGGGQIGPPPRVFLL